MTIKEQKAETQRAKRRAIERIKAMRAETKEDYRTRNDAERAVSSMAHMQQREGVGHDCSHRYIFQSDLVLALDRFFQKYPDAPSWEGTREQIIMLVNRHDIPVKSQFEFIFEADLDRVLKRTMLNGLFWSFPRFDATPEIEPPKPYNHNPNIFEL